MKGTGKGMTQHAGRPAVVGSWLGLFVLGSALCGACANAIEDGLPTGKLSDGGSSEGGSANSGSSGSGPRDAGPITLDAFFINDPPPPQCSPDGAVLEAIDPGGTELCPDDKNREGCPCPKDGETAACWPGKRVNRNLGVCKDGQTTCIQNEEFGLRWGRCEGYVLPTPGAVQGPEACGCFSDGTWTFENLVPCTDTFADRVYLYSSHPDGKGGWICNANDVEPPAAPPEDWTASTLKVGCAGHFTLCFTIKAGNVANPLPTDCVINRQCVDAIYETEGEVMKLPNLKGWASDDAACGQRFQDVGGYGEMSVKGQSAQCDGIDDGQGGEYVFQRPGYCKEGRCATGGSGTFGQ
jgi:hypothetical protein